MTDKHEREGHTTGQLILDGPDEFGDYTISRVNEALAVAAVISNMRPARVTEANARRLVAAWNACRGLKTADLEPGDPSVNLYELHIARADAAEAMFFEAQASFERLMTATDTEWIQNEATWMFAKLEARK